jgi:hypothetical protein
MRFVISARGEAREQYIVDAESEEQAREMFDRGDLPQPRISEVHDSELVSIDRITETEQPFLEGKALGGR